MLFTRENEDKKIVWKGVKEELETPIEEEAIEEVLPPEELEDLNPEENEVI